MIIAYSIDIEKKVIRTIVKAGDSIPPDTVWLDMDSPSRNEELFIERIFNIEVLNSTEISKAEVMSPCYREADTYYMTATFVKQNATGYMEGLAVTFILTNNCLITLHYAQPSSFRSFSGRLGKIIDSVGRSPDLILIALIENLVQVNADILETAGNELDVLLQKVFDNPVTSSIVVSTDYYNDVISKIGRTGNLISKNRESLMSLNRVLIYFSQMEDEKVGNKREQRLKLRHIGREMNSLSEYANFLSQRNSFLLDATLGVLSVEQNMIIKAFTIATAILMPPTLIATVYGMNFPNIPEIHWSMGYPLALTVMAVSALLPYFFFKKKGWL